MLPISSYFLVFSSTARASSIAATLASSPSTFYFDTFFIQFKYFFFFNIQNILVECDNISQSLLSKLKKSDVVLFYIGSKYRLLYRILVKVNL